MLGQAFGQGMSESANEQFQYNRNRSRLQNAFSEFENLANDPDIKKNPYKLLSKLGQAFAGIPGGQQVVSEIFPALLNRTQTQSAFDDIGGAGDDPFKDMGGSAQGTDIPGQQDQYFMGGGSEGEDTMFTGSNEPLVKNAPVGKSGVQNNEQFVGQRKGKIPPVVQNEIAQAKNGSIQPSQGVTPENPMGQGRSPLETPQFGEGPRPNVMSPGQLFNVEKWAQKNYPDQVDKIMQLYQNSNENQRKQFEDQARAWDVSVKMADETLRRQDQFRTFADERIDKDYPGLDPEDRAVFSDIADRFGNVKSLDEKYRLSKQAFDKYQSSANNLREKSTRNLFQSGNREQKKKLLQTAVLPLLNMGQYGKAKEILADGGWGEGEIADIISPLSKEAIQRFKSLPKIPDVNENIRALPDSPEYEDQIQQGIQRQDRIKDKYVDSIINNFETGGYTKPGTSLIGLRKLFGEKGVSWMDFRDMMMDAVEKGNLKLDPFQQEEFPLLGEAPQLGLWDFFNPFGGKR